MQSGIYLLRFSNDTFYIGQSKDIHRRYKKHCNDLVKNIHVNYRMLSAYHETKGLPILDILCECEEADLNRYEIEAFEIFSPTQGLGLNISPAAGDFPIMLGEANAFSRYSNDFIIGLVKYLVAYPDRPIKVLAKEYGVHYSTAKNIANGTSHTWLKEVVPDEYAILLSMKGTRSVNTSYHRGTVYKALSPQGVEYCITNITSFAKEHGLNRGALGQVLNGKANHHKGWTLRATTPS